VFTLAGEPGALHTAVLNGARAAIARIDITRHEGVHPRVGALDVAPIVYLDGADRGAACAEALVLADELGELGVPV
jgi:glutamate formiminotransferase / 5-formyltetrahydrofolate cyclo-ligase